MSDIFYTDNNRLEALREKAEKLPLSPGVYLMKNKAEKIIYVGKSKVLKNRVSQYFSQLSSHTAKTLRMVSQVYDFDIILTTSETEALNLENRLIKLHSPKYNIRLKDDKNYPYIKITLNSKYPTICVVRKREDDGAKYFGPYSATGAAYTIFNTARKTFGIPSCKRKFPNDIGKGRPCINYQIGQCLGVCTGKVSQEKYHESYEDAASLLSGSYASVAAALKEKMEYASENLQFEAAALYRDRISALKRLWEKQRVLAAPNVEQDVIAFYRHDVCSVLTVLYIRGGALTDSESFAFPAEQIDDSDSLATLILELYMKRSFVPKEILLGFDLDEGDIDVLSQLLSENAGYKVKIRTPERGDAKALCKMALDNAIQYSAEYRARTEKDDKTLIELAKLLKLEVVPERIEAFDISNIGDENITAGKILCVNGRFDKRGYRTYKIESGKGQDDYAAMREAVSRRFAHTEDAYPDLLLIDGGAAHVSVISQLLREMGVTVPVFGMVKDDHHKTRALVCEDGEISIPRDKPIFVLIYGIQEEVHRFTVSKMTNAKRKTIKTSSLEKIPGIGPAKSKAILKHFGGLAAVKNASLYELEQVGGLSLKDASSVYHTYHKITDEENKD